MDWLQNKCTNCKGIKNNTNFGKLLEYKRNWVQHVNRMPRNRLPMVMKRYSPTGRRNHGRPFKRLLDTWDRNGSTSGPTPWQIYDDDDDDDDDFPWKCIGEVDGWIQSFVTSALDGGEWSASHSVHSTCGGKQLLNGRLGGPYVLSWRFWW